MAHDDRRLEAAVALGIITAEQADAIRALGGPAAPAWERHAARPRVLGAAMLAYILGFITVVVAMFWFLADRWQWLGRYGVLATCVLYAVIFLVVAARLRREGYEAAGGFAVLLAILMVAPAVSSLNAIFAWFGPVARYSCGHPEFLLLPCRGEEILLELSVAAATLVALRAIRFGPLVIPLAAIAIRFCFHLGDVATRNGMSDGSAGWIWAFGASVLAAVAYATDRRQGTDQDFGLWLHLAGVAAAVPATLHLLSAYESMRHLLVPGAFVAFAAALMLRRFMWHLLGLAWFVGYLVWLASDVFQDSPVFPIVLATLGVGLLIATVWVQRNADRLRARFGGVSADGRPRFPGGVPLLLAPAGLALVLLPFAMRDDAERLRDEAWRVRRYSRQAARAAAAQRDSVARGLRRPLPPPRDGTMLPETRPAPRP